MTSQDYAEQIWADCVGAPKAAALPLIVKTIEAAMGQAFDAIAAKLQGQAADVFGQAAAPLAIIDLINAEKTAITAKP